MGTYTMSGFPMLRLDLTEWRAPD